jgi:hypothetical protein
MGDQFEHLNRFFDQVIRLTFWKRLFAWRDIRTLSYAAYEEFRSLATALIQISGQKEEVGREASRLQSENEHLKTNHATLERELRASLSQQSVELSHLKEKMDRISAELSAAQRENATLKQYEATRHNEYTKAVATLGAIQERTLSERKAEQEEQHRANVERVRLTKEKWSRHQEDVRNTIRLICQKHTIEYIDAVPFRGTPDNTIKVCDEYIVFDAKSPATEDLRNFPSYIKAQAEAVRKYVREENVRKEVFLVVPSSAVDVIEQYCYNLADYDVYVVTPNALEPIILSLKKLEDYEFVNQLSPDERENICRLIGKFAHAAKRRIQIDHFFAWEFLDVLTRCEASLPREMLERVMEFERAEKLNPPQERRAKQIATRDLETDTARIQKEAEAKEVTFPPSLEQTIKGLPLFEDDIS